MLPRVNQSTNNCLMAALMVFSVWLYPSVVYSEVELTSYRQENQQLLLRMQGFDLNNTPTGVAATLDRREIQETAFHLTPLNLAILIDTSGSCKVSRYEKLLSGHVEAIIKKLPEASNVTLVMYDYKRGVDVKGPYPKAQLQTVAVRCRNTRSMTMGTVVESLRRANKKFDSIIAYTSGNAIRHENQFSTLNAISKTTSIVSYLPISTPNRPKQSRVTWFSLPKNQSATIWFKELQPSLLQILPLMANVNLPIGKHLKPGNYSLDLQFLQRGQVMGKTSHQISIAPAPVKQRPFLKLSLKILAFTALILLCLAIYGYYRTPKCRKCKRPVLRAYRKKCLFCSAPGSMVLVVEKGHDRSTHPIRGSFSVGTKRTNNVRVDSMIEPGGFRIERDHGIYRLEPKHMQVYLNGNLCKNPRHLQHGDTIALGEVRCQVYVKAAA